MDGSIRGHCGLRCGFYTFAWTLSWPAQVPHQPSLFSFSNCGLSHRFLVLSLYFFWSHSSFPRFFAEGNLFWLQFVTSKHEFCYRCFWAFLVLVFQFFAVFLKYPWFILSFDEPIPSSDVHCEGEGGDACPHGSFYASPLRCEEGISGSSRR